MDDPSNQPGTFRAILQLVAGRVNVPSVPTDEPVLLI